MLHKPTLAAFILCSMLTFQLFAKTITDEKSNVSIDLPDADGWTITDGKTAGEKSTTAAHADGVSIIVLRFERTLPAVVMKRLADTLSPIITDAKAAEDGTDQVSLHGLQADKITGSASKDEKPLRFTAVLVATGNNSTLAVIAFGPETNFKRHLRDIDAAIGSVRPGH